MKSFKSEFVSRFPYLLRGLRVVWRASGKWTGFWCALIIVQATLPVMSIMLTRTAINNLTIVLANRGQVTAPGVWLPGLGIILIWLAGQAATSVVGIVRTHQLELVRDYLADKIHTQASLVDMSFFDNPECFDLMHRVRLDTKQPVLLLEHGGLIVQNLITVSGLSVILASYSLWLTFALLASIVPGLFFIGGYIKDEHAWNLGNTTKERWLNYYDNILVERAYTQEMRIFSMGGYFRKGFQELRAVIRRGRLKLSAKQLKAELLTGLASWIGITCAMCWMILKNLRKSTILSDLVLCFQTFQQGQKMIKLLIDSAGKIYLSLLYLEQLFTLLDMKPNCANPVHPETMPGQLRGGISFDNVDFRYPNGDRAVLKGLSFTAKAGEITAIVGLNGAGKSTIIKLLCRFYEPVAGSITFDGVNLARFDTSQIRSSISVLFQEPMRYHDTVEKNIRLGDYFSESDNARLVRAATGACADEMIAGFKDGYDTMLGWYFKGNDLSVGQWQRIALARALFKESAILILDEPTSAMDPWTETLWTQRIRKLSEGHTVLIITHRFTTAMHADKIILIENGHVKEQGSHNELIAFNGLYNKSWREQYKEIMASSIPPSDTSH